MQAGYENPLFAEEAIPWHGKRLFIGTGMYGKLHVMSEGYAAAEKERIEVVALPTPKLCGKLLKLKSKDVNAVLHVTCRTPLRATPMSA